MGSWTSSPRQLGAACTVAPSSPATRALGAELESEECVWRVEAGGGRRRPVPDTGDDHKSSRPLAVLLTLDRPSRNPESVILEANSKEVVQELRGTRPRPPLELPAHLLPPYPTHSIPRALAGPTLPPERPCFPLPPSPTARPRAHICSICMSSSSSWGSCK